MERIPEPELMDDEAQAHAYARADFSEPHDHFIDLFAEHFAQPVSGEVIDLGCGPGDICRRFARRFPDCRIHGVDGSQAMLDLATSATAEAGLDDRITYHLDRLPHLSLPQHGFDIVISNSLLHHLTDPNTLWDSVKRAARPGALTFVMDLMRPPDPQTARRLVEQYSADEPEVLRTDFYNSLRAAYRFAEIEQQLADNWLQQLTLETVSDRHLIVYGRLD